jgi:FKBP-type peptidyl-prolyl cis-trans isomerase FklB
MAAKRRFEALMILALAASGSLVGSLLAVETAPAPRTVEPVSDAGSAIDTPEGRLGYALGLRIGGRIAADFKDHDPPVDPAALARGLADAVLAARPQLDEQQLSSVLEGFEARMREKQEAFAKQMGQVATANREKGMAFLKTNASKPGVTVLPSGLQYEVLKAGTGPKPGPTDTVSTHYRGTHLDGKEFDATDPAGPPATFPLRGVVQGWQEALPLMPVGSRWRLYVPPELGYGEEGSPPVIEPNEVLVFEIELVKIGGQ